MACPDLVFYRQIKKSDWTTLDGGTGPAKTPPRGKLKWDDAGQQIRLVKPTKGSHPCKFGDGRAPVARVSPYMAAKIILAWRAYQGMVLMEPEKFNFSAYGNHSRHDRVPVLRRGHDTPQLRLLGNAWSQKSARK